jgi:hypothetical protein
MDSMFTHNVKIEQPSFPSTGQINIGWVVVHQSVAAMIERTSAGQISHAIGRLADNSFRMFVRKEHTIKAGYRVTDNITGDTYKVISTQVTQDMLAQYKECSLTRDKENG